MAIAIYKGGDTGKSGMSTGVKVYSQSDTATLEVEVVGDFTTLDNLGYGPGTYFQNGHAAWGIPSGYAILNCSLSREDGNVGVYKLTLVRPVGDLILNPYSITYEVEMQADMRQLDGHPHIQAGGDTTLNEIKLWEDSNEQADSEGPFYYKAGKDEEHREKVYLQDDKAKEYAKAKRSGIDSYGVYLPVVVRTSSYISINSGTVDSTISVPYSSNIGTFDSPPVSLNGFSGGSEHWFKSGDTYSRSNNGQWTRRETWTYVDITANDWIYDSPEQPNQSGS